MNWTCSALNECLDLLDSAAKMIRSGLSAEKKVRWCHCICCFAALTEATTCELLSHHFNSYDTPVTVLVMTACVRGEQPYSSRPSSPSPGGSPDFSQRNNSNYNDESAVGGEEIMDILVSLSLDIIAGCDAASEEGGGGAIGDEKGLGSEQVLGDCAVMQLSGKSVLAICGDLWALRFPHDSPFLTLHIVGLCHKSALCCCALVDEYFRDKKTQTAMGTFGRVLWMFEWWVQVLPPSCRPDLSPLKCSTPRTRVAIQLRKSSKGDETGKETSLPPRSGSSWGECCSLLTALAPWWDRLGYVSRWVTADFQRVVFDYLLLFANWLDLPFLSVATFLLLFHRSVFYPCFMIIRLIGQENSEWLRSGRIEGVDNRLYEDYVEEMCNILRATLIVTVVGDCSTSHSNPYYLLTRK